LDYLACVEFIDVFSTTHFAKFFPWGGSLAHPETHPMEKNEKLGTRSVRREAERGKVRDRLRRGGGAVVGLARTLQGEPTRERGAGRR